MMDPPTGSPQKMEARQTSGAASSSASYVWTPPRVDEVGHVYGSRWVEVKTADGGIDYQEVPLYWEDLFDPQEGDRLMHGPEHAKTTRETTSRLDCLFDRRGRDDVVVYDDVRCDWKTPGVPPACPDVIVIPGMKKPPGAEKPRSFNETKEGTSPLFALEITSKETANYDRKTKPEIYRRAKVPELFLLDEMKSPWTLSGKRLNPRTGRYVEVQPDARGRLLSETLQVYFSVAPSGDDLVLEDAETGEVLLTPVQESRKRREAEAKVRELLAEVERLKSTRG